MKSYEVNIVARVNTTLIVEAEDKERACEIAEQEWGEAYIVYNPDTQEYSDFSEIIGYEPGEVV